MAKTCQICGKPSGLYPLCLDCFALRDKGEVLKCEECGVWHKKGTPCKCSKPAPKQGEDKASKTCQICGKPSGSYPICRDCFALKDKGEVLKCEECGVWHRKNDPCKCSKPMPTKTAGKAQSLPGTCIVCGKETRDSDHPLCKVCWQEMCGFKETFDKNMQISDLSDYYYNLKSNIYRIKTFERVQENCLRLFALAEMAFEVRRHSVFKGRVVADIKELIAAKTDKPQPEPTIKTIQKDSAQENLLRTQDGHRVKSNYEVVVDDMFYTMRLVHEYGRPLALDEGEKSIEADWFIPINSTEEGVYVELWGMNTPEYLANRARKKETYQRNGIPLIEIEGEETRDLTSLKNRIKKELNKWAKELYRRENFVSF